MRCDQLAERIADGEEFFLGYIKKSVDKCRIRCYYRQAVACDWETDQPVSKNKLKKFLTKATDFGKI